MFIYSVEILKKTVPIGSSISPVDDIVWEVSEVWFLWRRYYDIGDKLQELITLSYI